MINGLGTAEVTPKNIQRLASGMSMYSVKPGKYLHSKSGQLYEVLGVAVHTETAEPMVVYRPLYKTVYELFVRPYTMFVEDVEIGGEVLPRFERVGG